METATFAGGCFWCTEAVFLQLDGVASVRSGYIGGKTINPTYNEIGKGDTGHAEAIEISFDPTKITFSQLLEVFFATHDPTTLNRQGNDVGTQYRSEIFYHSEIQRRLGESFVNKLNGANNYGKRLVTRVSPATVFYPAEDYHQNYYNRNQDAGYCSYVIAPKIEKTRSKFADKVKS